MLRQLIYCNLSQPVVKMIPHKPAEHLSVLVPIKNTTKGSSKATFTDADLPVACLPLWNEFYTPLLFDWAGTLQNPLKCRKADLRENLQSNWETAYPHLVADIQPKQPIFVRVCISF